MKIDEHMNCHENDGICNRKKPRFQNGMYDILFWGKNIYIISHIIRSFLGYVFASLYFLLSDVQILLLE